MNENILCVQEKMKHNVDDLQLAVIQLDVAMQTLPRENLQSMISTLSVSFGIKELFIYNFFR